MNENPGSIAEIDDLVSVQKAARLLRVSDSTIWRWIRAGLLASYRIGPKRTYLKRSEIVGNLQASRARAGDIAVDIPRTPAEADETLRQTADLLRDVRALHARQLAKPRWGCEREAWEDINEMRDERSWQMDDLRRR